MAETNITARALADELNRLDNLDVQHPTEDGPWLYWSRGYVEMGGERLEIDRAASDALADRLGHKDRNESESRWIVAGGLEVEHADGVGWRPAPPAFTHTIEELIGPGWQDEIVQETS
jgi:hypothetical protein